jgi:anthranilate phosphoribosyltransferase
MSEVDRREMVERILDGRALSAPEAGALLGLLIDPAEAPERKAAVLGALRARGETAEEVRGLAMEMRRRAMRFARDPAVPVVDTCGTGGDGSHSLNVSTAAALLTAACGLRVAKHGNRSISSRCGSADVLHELGISVDLNPEAASIALARDGFAFLFAPTYHAATGGVAEVRRALASRTVFNLLGPLSNPAAPEYQLVGAWSEESATLMADALAGMPVQRACVVHGEPGWDEATPCGPFLRLDVQQGRVVRSRVDPADLGIARCDPDELRGGSADLNARRAAAVLQGEEDSPYRDAVVLNAALALEVAGTVADLQAGISRAMSAIDGGAAGGLLDRLAGGALE